MRAAGAIAKPVPLSAPFDRAVAGEFGQALTSKGGRLGAQSESVRDRVAIFENGYWFALETHARDNAVQSVKNLARLASIQLRDPVVLDMERIRELNAASPGSATARAGTAELQTTERDIINRLGSALRDRASDIHVTIDGGIGAFEYRIDGVLVPIEEASPVDLKRFIRSAFTMADTRDANFVETQTQSGRIASGDRFKLPDGLETVRMTYAPTPSGAVLAMRLLHSQGAKGGSGLRGLGYAGPHIETLDELTDLGAGAIIVAGQMNSGKSTAVKCALEWTNEKAEGGRRMVTIEDPVELRIEGAIQTSITDARTTEERAERFAQQIRTTLRMDVNDIMVGEIRDATVAQAAIEVAMTGHKLWTTVHTYSAFGIIERLLDLGVEPYKVGNAKHIVGLVCQSLLRRLCRHCAIPLSDPKAPIKPHLRKDLEELGVDISRVRIGHAKGCSRCLRGFHGRTLVAEVVRTDPEIMSHVRGGHVAAAEKAWLAKLEPTMFEHAMTKILSGEVCPVEAAQRVGDARLSGARREVVGAILK